MIKHLEAIKGTEAYENVVRELNILGRKKEFFGVRYRWSELVSFAMYLNDFSNQMAGESSEYIETVLRPFNEAELDFIFSIKRTLKQNDKPTLDSLFQQHHVNVARVKRICARHTDIKTKIKTKLGV
ncbi:hypothetical protein [Teredinibacter haidensis]|uniref:hypothetical protein n=1 Tax=Teredinibacter haidensis TaxID=2731755 RepID=UPI0009490EB0|nr:hypothetical protein [Teredinibacter haidensis]